MQTVAALPPALVPQHPRRQPTSSASSPCGPLVLTGTPESTDPGNPAKSVLFVLLLAPLRGLPQGSSCLRLHSAPWGQLGA